MNEDGTPAAADTSADNINSEEGGVSSDEVAQVLNLPKSEASEETKGEEEAPVEPETPENPESQNVEKTETEEEAPEKTEEVAPVAETPEAPTFTVEIEDANGKTFTVGPEDNLEEVLAEFEPKNNGQVLQLMRDLDRLTGEKKAWQDQQAADKAEAERAEELSKIQAGWDDEIKTLQGNKRLPLDEKITERTQQVFKYMAEENEKREKEGRPLLHSFEDALDKLELRESKEAEATARKDAKNEARRRGGMVGGSSAPATSSPPVYVAGSARNASEAVYNMGLLGK